MSEAGVRRLAVRCAKHGLHYNPALHDGCARCRRERDGAPASEASTVAVAGASRRSWGRAFAVTGGLIALATLALVAAHRPVVALLGRLLFAP